MDVSRMARVANASVVAEPNEAVFDAFYRSQWLPMVRFACLTTGSTPLAEEIVQDAFADVYRRWDRIEVPIGYLRRAVTHRCTSWVRRQRLERRAPTVTSASELDSRLIELLDAMKILTPRQRAAIVLRYVDDLPEADIALVLSCRPGTVKSLLARALTRLQEVVPQ
jgi:RNA polymerase sigma-70 factor (sigma-E family)